MENIESKKNRSTAEVAWRKESTAMAEVEDDTPRTDALSRPTKCRPLNGIPNCRKHLKETINSTLLPYMKAWSVQSGSDGNGLDYPLRMAANDRTQNYQNYPSDRNQARHHSEPVDKRKFFWRRQFVLFLMFSFEQRGI